jgi:hypothetical protein
MIVFPLPEARFTFTVTTAQVVHEPVGLKVMLRDTPLTVN